jgi:hypothetical protein
MFESNLTNAAGTNVRVASVTSGFIRGRSDKQPKVNLDIEHCEKGYAYNDLTPGEALDLAEALVKATREALSL